jgi:hypothetical protein
MDGEQATIERDGSVRSGHKGNHMTAPAQRIEVITRGERRRRWSIEEKREIVAESLGIGVRLERQVSEFVDDQQLRLGIMRQTFLQSAVGERLRQLRHQRRRRREQHGVAGHDCLAPDRHRQMRLADAGWPEQQHGLAVGDILS